MNMKRIIAAAVSMAMTCLMMPADTISENIAFAETEIWDGTTDVSWYDEEETEFHISTAEELAGLVELVNAGHSTEGRTFYLDNDIYLNDVSNYTNWETTEPENKWTPFRFFQGVFEGQGRTITGMFSGRYSSDYSFFGSVTDTSAIKDLHFDYAYVDTSRILIFANKNYLSGSFSTNVGGICRGNEGSITNCSFDGVINWDASDYGNNYTRCCGAICAYNYGTISGCTADGSITVNIQSSENYVGGICGLNYGNITKCRNQANISNNGWAMGSSEAYQNCTGGICGMSELGINSMPDCCNHCCNYGDITSSPYLDSYSAGICNVKLWNGLYAEKQVECLIENCYNRGAVTGKTGAAGIVGVMVLNQMTNCAVKNAYNTGTISSSNGIVGDTVLLKDTSWKADFGTYTMESCYYLVGSALSSGVAKSASNMQKADFAESLGNAFVYSEGGYPLLAWEVGLQQEPLPGDVNLDGTFDLADIKLLQDYLVSRETLTAEQGSAADVYADHVLNGFDLSLLRGMYLEQSQTAS